MMAVVLFFAVNLLWFRPAPGTAADFSRARIVGWVLVALLGVAHRDADLVQAALPERDRMVG